MTDPTAELYPTLRLLLVGEAAVNAAAAPDGVQNQTSNIKTGSPPCTAVGGEAGWLAGWQAG